jgi:hypothetical protein
MIPLGYIAAGVYDLPRRVVYHIYVNFMKAHIIVVVNLSLLVFSFRYERKIGNLLSQQCLQG